MKTVFSKHKFNSFGRIGAYLNYLKYSPEKSKTVKLPLIIYIHGAGSRGNDLDNFSVVDSLLKRIESGRIPAILTAPQCHADTWFELFDVLLEFIDCMRNQPDIDINRIYICGGSMGGYTVWQVCMSKPDWFAAAVPICGGGMYWNAARLKNLPVWAFHGEEDQTVSVEESRKMVGAINLAGGNARLTVFSGIGHDSWTPAFQSDEMWAWLFAQNNNTKRLT